MTVKGFIVDSSDITKNCPIQATNECLYCEMREDKRMECWALYAFKNGGHLISSNIFIGGIPKDEAQIGGCGPALEVFE